METIITPGQAAMLLYVMTGAVFAWIFMKRLKKAIERDCRCLRERLALMGPYLHLSPLIVFAIWPLLVAMRVQFWVKNRRAPRCAGCHRLLEDSERHFAGPPER